MTDDKDRPTVEMVYVSDGVSIWPTDDPRRAATVDELEAAIAKWRAENGTPELAAENARLRAEVERLMAERDAATSRAAALQGRLSDAWRMYQDAAIGREWDGRSGNPALDRLASKLDEWASEE